MTTLPIRLSAGFEPLVKEGDTVKTGDKLAKRQVKTDISYNLARALSVPVRKVPKLIKRNPGDRITPGDVIAEKKGFISVQRIIAEISGTVLRYERDTGTIVVKPEEIFASTITDDITEEMTDEGKVEFIVSPLDGSITLCNNEQIQIQTDKNVLVGTDGIGNGSEGEIHFIASRDEQSSEVQSHDVTTKAIGKVILGKAFSREVLMKAVSIGVTGIIGTDIDDADFVYLVGKDVKTPVIKVPDDIFTKLTKHVGKKVYLEGKSKTILLLNYEVKHS
jgi:hypothetical protein